MVKRNVGTVNGKRQTIRVRRKKRAATPKGRGGAGRPIFVIKKRGRR